MPIDLEEHEFSKNKSIVPSTKQIDSTVGFALTYNTAKKNPISISTGNGFRIKLVAENSDFFPNDYQGTIFSLDLRTYIPLGRHAFSRLTL